MFESGLLDQGYKKSKIDPFMFYKPHSTMFTSVDECIMSAKDYKKNKQTITWLQKNFKLTDEEDLSTYLGIDITKNPNSSWILLKPFFVDRVINALNLQNDSKNHNTSTTEVLTYDKKGSTLHAQYYYVSLQGILTHVSGSTKPGIQHIFHQESRLSNSPKEFHGKAIKRIGNYLKKD